MSKNKPIFFISRFNKSNFKTVDHEMPFVESTWLLVFSTIRFIYLARKYLIKYKKIYDSCIIYCPAFHPWNLILLWLSKFYKIEIAITIHDYPLHKGENSFLVRWIQSDTIKHSDKLVFLSQYVKDRVQRTMDIKPKTIVLTHPILNSNSKNTLEHSVSPAILFLGRFKKYKGIALLLEAIKDLPYRQMTIAGDGQSLNIMTNDSRIKVINKRLPEDHIKELLNTHELIILPYIEASQSGILALALSSNIVIIATDVGGLKEQINHEAILWCKPDIKDIHQLIKHIIENPLRYQKQKEVIKKSVEVYKSHWLRQYDVFYKFLVGKIN